MGVAYFRELSLEANVEDFASLLSIVVREVHEQTGDSIELRHSEEDRIRNEL